jgi:hypothetical protein
MRIHALALVISLSLAGLAQAQAAPAANAGKDVTIGCVGPAGTPINLDGTQSSIGAGFTYLWTATGVTFNDPTSLTPIGVFPVGATEVTLTVTFTDPVTGVQSTASDTAVVTVSDSTPPMAFASPDPSVLWPPNHKLQDVQVDVVAFDTCDSSPEVELVSISSSEPDNGIGDGNSDADIQGADLGTDDRSFQLRAERSGPGSGRTYSALYRVTDSASNHTDLLVRVLVPHDMGHGGMSNDDDAMHETEQQIAVARKASLKAAKAQLKAAKQAAKAAKKAYKAALRAAP